MTTDGIPKTSRTIKASEFKAKCLQLMDEVAETGEEIIITKRGKPVSKLAPYLVPYREKPKTLFGIDRGRIEILGDIVSPMPPEWYEDTTESDQDLRTTGAEHDDLLEGVECTFQQLI